MAPCFSRHPSFIPGLVGGLVLEPIAVITGLNNAAMMGEPIQQCGGELADQMKERCTAGLTGG